DDRGDKGGPGVLEAPQDTGGGEHDEHGRYTDRRPAQVGHRLGGDVGSGAENLDERAGEDGHEHSAGGPEEQGEPDAVDAGADGTPLVARAEPAGDGRGGAVGQEDEEVDRGQQDGAGDAEPGEGGGAEVADDRRVGEQEKRLGDEGEEGRD